MLLNPVPNITYLDLETNKNYPSFLKYLKKKTMDGALFSTRHFEGKRRPKCRIEIEGLSFPIKKENFNGPLLVIPISPILFKIKNLVLYLNLTKMNIQLASLTVPP